MSENQYAPLPSRSAPGGASGGSAEPGGAVDPGRTLGIVGLILAFLVPLVGLILSIVALNQSKRVGLRNSLARWGVIVSIVVMALSLVIGVIAAIAGVITGSASITYY